MATVVRSSTIRVRGLTELLRQLPAADRETRLMIRAELRKAAETVRDEARARFGAIDERTAAGYRIAVRQRGIAVEQSIRKTTGTRPDYGGLQMRRALLPALDSERDAFEHEVEAAFDRIVEKLNH